MDRRQIRAEAKQECSDQISAIAENPALIRLHAGELTTDEMRAVRAVLRFVAFKINERQ